MVTLNSDTCDKISVFCAACAGVVPGAAVGAAAFAIPALIKHLSGASSLEKLLKDTSKEIKANVGEWTRQSREYKLDELASAEGAIENITGKLQPDPKSLMNANRDHKKLADRAVIYASQNSVEFSRKKLPGKAQAKINRQILRIILEKTLKALEGHADYEAELVPYFQREVLNRFGGLADGQAGIFAELAELKSMVARLPQAEVKAAEEAGIPHLTIIKLAQRINDDVTDPDQALKELENAVDIAIDAANKGRLGSNLDAFVSEVLKRVAELSNQGKNDEASKEVDSAFEQWQERQEREKLAGLELLDSGLKQDILRRDAIAAAKRLLQKAEIDYPEQKERFNHLRTIMQEWYYRGLYHGLRLELEISAKLAKLTVMQAKTPDQRSIALNDLAVSLGQLGARAGGNDAQKFLQQSVAALDFALEVTSRDNMPARWAMTQMNRAITRRKLGGRAEGEQAQDYLQQAIVGFDLALEVTTRDIMPVDWALAQMNRAVALRSLGQQADGGDGQDYLQQAVAGYDLALEVRTRDVMPAEWAMTQMNRAIALRNLGERAEGDEAQDYLEQAIAAYDLALEINTREAIPAEWATTQMNRAVAFQYIGEHVGGDERQKYYKQAVAACDLALEVFDETGMEYQADVTRDNRQIVLDALAKLKNR